MTTCVRPLYTAFLRKKLERENETLAKLNSVLEDIEWEITKGIMKLEDLGELIDKHSKTGKDAKLLRRLKSKYKYIYNRVTALEALKNIVTDVMDEVANSPTGKISTKTTFILPGALSIVKRLANNELTVDEAVREVLFVKRKGVELARILATKYNTKFLLPKDVDPSRVNVKVWVDYAGKERDGSKFFALVLYVAFPSKKGGKIKEYEPVVFVFRERDGDYELVKAHARVHYDVYVYNLVGVRNVTVLFTKHGYTPKILEAPCKPVKPSPKVLLDMAWLVIGDAITRLSGVRSVKLKRYLPEIKVHYRLPRSEKNPFTTPVHPYFYYVEI